MRLELDRQDERVLEDLAHEIATKPVLGLCGSGMSCPLGYPTWQGLIRDIVTHLQAICRSDLPPDIWPVVDAGAATLPRVAQWAKDQMDRTEYFNFLKKRFSYIGDVDFSREQEMLADLGLRLWLTTNYDRCLEEALGSRLGQGITSTLRVPFDELLGARTTLPSVVHLHGTHDSPETVILTADDYTEMYERAPRRTRELSSLGPLSVLFIGSGLQDDELNICLKTTEAVLGHSAQKHYAILPRFEAQFPFAIEMRSRDLMSMGVKAIFYPVRHNDHSGRVLLLEKLLSLLGKPLPPPLPEIDLGYAGEDRSVERMRSGLRELRESAHVKSPLIVRACRPEKGQVRLALRDAWELENLKKTVGASRSWVLRPSGDGAFEEEPPRECPAFIDVPGRDGKVIRLSAEQAKGSPVVNRADLEEPPLGEPASQESPQKKEAAPNAVMALLHAMALGKVDPSVGEARHLLKPLLPAKLPFCLADCFHPVLDWRLDSPVVHVWVYTGQATEKTANTAAVVTVVAVGTGPASIRHELESAAYAAAMVYPDAERNIITRGFIYLSASEKTPVDYQRGRVLRGIRAFGQTEPVPSVSSVGGGNPLDSFRATCERLARETGFLQVHTVPFEELTKFNASLFHLVLSPPVDSSSVLGPGLGARVLTYLPYPYFPELCPKIELRLSGDLLKSPELSLLLNAFYQNIITRIQADLERRIEFWTQEVERDEGLVEWWNHLPEAQRARQPDVTTGRKILEDLGIDMPTEERKVPALIYYGIFLPKEIPHEKSVLQKLQESRAPLARFREREHSAIWRQCLGRIFDCAFRQVPLCDDRDVNQLFQNWAARVDGMLCLEWHRHLARLGLRPDALFKRTTILDVDYDEASNCLLVYPVALIDSGRSTIVGLEENQTLQVHDPLDEARPVACTPPDAHRATPELAPELSVGQSDTLAAHVPQLLWERPELAQRICACMADPRGRSAIPAHVRQSVAAKVKAATAGRRFFYLLHLGLFNTAVEALQEEEADPAPLPGRSLALAWISCVRHSFSPLETLRALHANLHFPAPREVVEHFTEALEKDRQLVEEFLRVPHVPLPDALALSDAEGEIRSLLRCSDALTLARCFDEAASSLSPEGETQASAFLKAEHALELAHTSPFSRVALSMIRLQRYLTGEPESDR